MKINNPSPKVEYFNRYNEKHIFTKINSKQILWEGDFFSVRMGYPNNYNNAYNAYLKNEPPHDHSLSFEEFTEAVHEYDRKLEEYKPLAKKYQHLVTSNRNIINMCDPSGGPHLKSGMNMKQFGFNRDLIIKEFKFEGTKENQILIILE